MRPMPTTGKFPLVLRHFLRATWPVILVAALGCGTTGPYVWARDLKPDEVGSNEYSIVVDRIERAEIPTARMMVRGWLR